jgi:hypothetical protein
VSRPDRVTAPPPRAAPVSASWPIFRQNLLGAWAVMLPCDYPPVAPGHDVLVVRRDGTTTTVTLTQLVQQHADGTRRWLFTTKHPTPDE